eukprot:Skav229011  [mRNA]  locus=scaffold127:436959:437183:+ [translate_table: standard]
MKQTWIGIFHNQGAFFNDQALPITGVVPSGKSRFFCNLDVTTCVRSQEYAITWSDQIYIIFQARRQGLPARSDP